MKTNPMAISVVMNPIDAIAHTAPTPPGMLITSGRLAAAGPARRSAIHAANKYM